MNGYINVEILGKNRGLKFGMVATQQIFLQAEKLKVTLGESVDIAILPAVVYWGLYNNCLAKNVDTDFTWEEVYDWVEDNMSNGELLKSIMLEFYDSKLVKGSVEAEKKNTISPKKKGGIK
jgi:hypothetical protein